MPQLLTRATEEVHLPGLARTAQRVGVHVRERQHLARAPILHHARNEAALVKNDLGVIHGRLILSARHGLHVTQRRRRL